MDIRVAQVQGRVPVTVFHITGSIHLGNAEQLETEARTAIGNGTRDLLFDLTDVTSMTSAGLRVLHVLYKLLENNAHHTQGQGERTKAEHFKLANPSPSLLRVLTIAGFDTFLEIHDTVPDAIASF